MMYVLDLIDILHKYQATIFQSLVTYKKAPEMPDAPLADKLQIIADYPNSTGLGDLSNTTKPLCVIITLVDNGEIRIGGEYGAGGAEKRLSEVLEVWTADPMLRETAGAEVYSFLEKNPGLVTGIRSNWTFDMIQSNGYKTAPAGYYRRSYSLWLREFNLY